MVVVTEFVADIWTSSFSVLSFRIMWLYKKGRGYVVSRHLPTLLTHLASDVGVITKLFECEELHVRRRTERTYLKTIVARVTFDFQWMFELTVLSSFLLPNFLLSYLTGLSLAFLLLYLPSLILSTREICQHVTGPSWTIQVLINVRADWKCGTLTSSPRHTTYGGSPLLNFAFWRELWELVW